MGGAEGSSKDNRWSLQGMTALVTDNCNASSHAIVEELAGLGARVHTCCRTESQLKNCLLQWKAKGFHVTASVCDVSNQAQREKLIKTVSSEFDGKLNILVNNVGNNIGKMVSDYTAEDVSFWRVPTLNQLITLAYWLILSLNLQRLEALCLSLQLVVLCLHI
ncbi:Tropinone reductase-like protein [Hibiscus syriacus]|uniref:Tropinone reductase-like protein n=1 Tax=Hibiscus syriacus TaxID=106335 RepID=A0A6A3CEN0_HIBSY|nr:Tropinone reductase-like protein [Hibiscus syriacus]